jgi:hypothetical protein
MGVEQEWCEAGFGSMQTRTHGANGNCQYDSNLFIGHLLQLAEDDYFFQQCGQLIDSLTYGCHGFLAREMYSGVVVS